MILPHFTYIKDYVREKDYNLPSEMRDYLIHGRYANGCFIYDSFWFLYLIDIALGIPLYEST